LYRDRLLLAEDVADIIRRAVELQTRKGN